MFQPKVVAAIDFGTHGSGFAWAVVCKPNANAVDRQILSNDQWQDQPLAYPKNRTALLLDPNGAVDSWGHEAVSRFNVQNGHGQWRLVQGFELKMALQKPGDLPMEEVEQLIAAYLARVYQTALQHISDGGFEEDDIRWSLTIPAIWDEHARQMTRRAAGRAGMPTDEDRLLLAIEPEAAALYARNKLAGGGVERPGVRFLVVDAGGGTVDLTAYEVNDDNRLSEVVTAGGGPFGAEYVNNAFRTAILQQRLADDDGRGGATRLAELEGELPGLQLELLRAFEKLKVTFDPDSADPARIPIPTRLDRQLDEKARDTLASRQDGVDYDFIVSPAEFRALFDEVLEPTLALINEQLAKVCAGTVESVYVLLVGGFAQSKYFQQQLRNLVEDQATLLVPPHPALAVLFGAVHFAYDPSALRHRRSRFTYGCNMASPAEPGDRADYRTNDEDGTPFTSNRFQIFVSAGESVEVDQEVVHMFVPRRTKDRDVSFDLFRTTDPAPYYDTEEGMLKIGTIKFMLPASIMNLPRKERNIYLAMRFGGTQITVSARINGTDQAVDTTVEFDPTW